MATITIHKSDSLREIVYEKMAPHFNFMPDEGPGLVQKVKEFCISDDTEGIITYDGKFSRGVHGPYHFRLVKEETE